MEEASGAGISFKFSQELDELNASAVAAIESLPASTSKPGGDLALTVREALEDAAASPRAALILLSAVLEREVRKLAAQTGQLFENPSVSHGRPVTANTLRLFNLPPTVLAAVDQFRDVRNRIVHGRDASNEEILRAIDSAVTILEALDRVSREVNIVHASDVPLYADSEGLHQRDGVHGVILRRLHTANPDEDSLRIHPTTRTHFRVGEPVAWEWNRERQWSESWYRDPETGHIAYAFTSSLEFVGTPLADV